MNLRLLLVVALSARVASAQSPDTTVRAPGATVSGAVHDSLARKPLAGAMVQLVAADSLARYGRTAVSDSLGRFTLGGVPDGRYTLGFFHPMLDSLGMEPPLREVTVSGHHAVRVDLAIPSRARFRAAICSARSAADSGAVIVGVVRNAGDHAPTAGATVVGEWLELSFTSGGLVRRIPRLVATTGEKGWFAICHAPSSGMMTLRASRGADSTDLLEVQVPGDGFLRRDLYLGAARPVVAGDATRPAVTPAPPVRRELTGDGRLSGTVLTTMGGLPLAGAQVSIADGPRTRANERGAWTLVTAPLGTRMLEVRAVGYYPERRPVHVVADGSPVHVELNTLKAVLDTIRVSATRLAYDRDRHGFQERRRSGVGRYLTPQDIARRQPVFTSDLFRNVPGVRVDNGFGLDRQISMRGIMGGSCAPAIHVDGFHVRGLSGDDLDGWVNPKDIAGIEIYGAGMVPPQFQEIMNGCGGIVIWTK